MYPSLGVCDAFPKYIDELAARLEATAATFSFSIPAP